jgi:hypothetical protein
MLNFSCPRCRQNYQSDVAHLGKSIRCTKCGDIVSVARQDGSYWNSGSSLQTGDEASGVSSWSSTKPFPPYKQTKTIRWKRSVTLISATLVCLFLVYVAFLIGRFRREPQPDAAVSGPRQINPPDGTRNRGAPQAKEGNNQTPVNFNSSEVEIEGEPAASAKRPDQTNSLRPKQQIVARNPNADATHSLEREAKPVVNGDRIIPDGATTGHGQLEAVNGTDHDAYVLVVDVATDLQVRWILIRRGLRVTLDHLDPGNYRVVFSTGLDWNQTARKFNSNADYFQMGKDLSFEETRNAEGTRYDHHSITLYPVPDGNIRMIHLSEAQFRALSGKQ